MYIVHYTLYFISCDPVKAETQAAPLSWNLKTRLWLNIVSLVILFKAIIITVWVQETQAAWKQVSDSTFPFVTTSLGGSCLLLKFAIFVITSLSGSVYLACFVTVSYLPYLSTPLDWSVGYLIFATFWRALFIVQLNKRCVATTPAQMGEVQVK